MGDDSVPYMRIPISLPCTAPVVPGTPDTTAPLEERTEVCAVDGFWMVGQAIMCDIHVRVVLGEEAYAEMVAEAGPSLYDGKPWGERHRYSQEDARTGLWEGHPLSLP